MRRALVLLIALTLFACSDDEPEAAAPSTTAAPATAGCEALEPSEDPNAAAVLSALEDVGDVTVSAVQARASVDDPALLEVSVMTCSPESLDDEAAVELGIEMAQAVDASTVGEQIGRLAVNLFTLDEDGEPQPDGQLVADDFGSRLWNSPNVEPGALRAGVELRR